MITKLEGHTVLNNITMSSYRPPPPSQTIEATKKNESNLYETLAFKIINSSHASKAQCSESFQQFGRQPYTKA